VGRVLVDGIGRDLSPPAFVAAMVASGEGWRTAVSFCEAVMLQKEAAERDRERADFARRRRLRARRPAAADGPQGCAVPSGRGVHKAFSSR